MTRSPVPPESSTTSMPFPLFFSRAVTATPAAL
jgi:hypothetical protein